MFRGELLDLKEILTYLELNPRTVSPEASERKLVEASFSAFQGRIES